MSATYKIEIRVEETEPSYVKTLVDQLQDVNIDASKFEIRVFELESSDSESERWNATDLSES